MVTVVMRPFHEASLGEDVWSTKLWKGQKNWQSLSRRRQADGRSGSCWCCWWCSGAEAKKVSASGQEFLGSPNNVLQVAPQLRPGLGKCFGVGHSRPRGSGRRRDDGFVFLHRHGFSILRKEGWSNLSCNSGLQSPRELDLRDVMAGAVGGAAAVGTAFLQDVDGGGTENVPFDAQFRFTTETEIPLRLAWPPPGLTRRMAYEMCCAPCWFSQLHARWAMWPEVLEPWPSRAMTRYSYVAALKRLFSTWVEFRESMGIHGNPWWLKWLLKFQDGIPLTSQAREINREHDLSGKVMEAGSKALPAAHCVMVSCFPDMLSASCWLGTSFSSFSMFLPTPASSRAAWISAPSLLSSISRCLQSLSNWLQMFFFLIFFLTESKLSEPSFQAIAVFVGWRLGFTREGCSWCICEWTQRQWQRPVSLTKSTASLTRPVQRILQFHPAPFTSGSRGRFAKEFMQLWRR